MALNNKFKLILEQVPYEIEQRGDLMLVNGQEFPIKIDGSNVSVTGNPHAVTLAGTLATVDGINYNFEAIGLEEMKEVKKRKAVSKESAAEAGAITAIMPGLIIKVLKKEGDTVEQGDIVLILEAMKMQNEMKAPKAGIIRKIHVKAGESVEIRQVLALIE